MSYAMHYYFVIPEGKALLNFSRRMANTVS